MVTSYKLRDRGTKETRKPGNQETESIHETRDTKNEHNYMISKRLQILLLLFALTLSGYAQLGIKAGINMANQIRSFRKADIIQGFSTENLTGFQIGVIYEAFPRHSDMGTDVGLFISQKGFAYTDSTQIVNDLIALGYHEYNYIELPINLRYRYSHKLIGAYASGGIYGAYLLSAKSVDETSNSIENMSFRGVVERLDYGYSLNAGIELLRQIQLGLSWTHGLKYFLNTIASKNTSPEKKDNRVFSINLTYLFR